MKNVEKKSRTRRNARHAIVATGLAMFALVLLVPSAAHAQCLTPPTFAGLQTVVNPTSSTCTLRLTWNAATPTCGGTITYTVYRSTQNNFTPDAATRIASDVASLTYDDSADLASGVRYHYIVRARSSANWVEDTNIVEEDGTASYEWSTPVIVRDFFEAPNRPANPNAWWTFGAFAGDNDNKSDIYLSNTCGSYSAPFVYRFGQPNQCDKYSSKEESSVVLGGDGSVNPTINGFHVPADVENAQLTFMHKYALEPGYDGGHLMYSLVGPLTGYVEIPDTFTPGQPWIEVGGYNAVIPTTTGPVRAWTGTYLTWSPVVVNIAELRGKTVWFVWRFSTNENNNTWVSPAEAGYWFDNVQLDWTVATGFCNTCPSPVKQVTARAASYLDPVSGTQRGSVKLEWTAKPNAAVNLYRNGELTPFTTANTNANGYGTYLDQNLNLGTPYAYDAEVQSGLFASKRRSVSATPLDSTSRIKWKFATGAAALTPPGLYPGPAGVGRIYSVSNDRSAYAVNVRDRNIPDSGGDWIGSPWLPPLLNAPVHGRPATIKVKSGWTIGAASYWMFIASQDGYAYGYDADRGGDPLWRTGSRLGDMLVAAPTGWFRMNDTAATQPAADVLVIGTRTTAGAARSHVVGLNPANGTELWRFDNLVTQGGDGTALGIVSSAVSIDYTSYPSNPAKRRAYFATRQHVGTPTGSQHSLWCIEFDHTATVRKLWSLNLGNIDSAPIMRNGVLYAGTNSGQVWAINADTGAVVWGPFATLDGPAKGFVWVDAARNRAYFATTGTVWALDLTTGTMVWQLPITNPSTITSVGTTIYVGSGDGKIYELKNVVTGPPTVKSQVVGDGSTVGTPTLDVVNSVLYVGSDSGRLYSVAIPLP